MIGKLCAWTAAGVSLGLIGGVRAYQLFVRPVLPAVCRFTPSCSIYSIEALEKHGAAAGSYLTVSRIARCNPWCEGGHDPVPQAKPRLFGWAQQSKKT